MRTRLKAQIAAAKVNGQLQSTVGGMSTSSAMAAFERMEDKVLQLEARSQAAAGLAGADLESRFASLESIDVDVDLEALKQQMLASASASQPSLPASGDPTGQQQTTAAPKDAVIDSDLEDLKKQLEQL